MWRGKNEQTHCPLAFLNASQATMTPLRVQNIGCDYHRDRRGAEAARHGSRVSMLARATTRLIGPNPWRPSRVRSGFTPISAAIPAGRRGDSDGLLKNAADFAQRVEQFSVQQLVSPFSSSSRRRALNLSMLPWLNVGGLCVATAAILPGQMTSAPVWYPLGPLRDLALRRPVPRAYAAREDLHGSRLL